MNVENTFEAYSAVINGHRCISNSMQNIHTICDELIQSRDCTMLGLLEVLASKGVYLQVSRHQLIRDPSLSSLLYYEWENGMNYHVLDEHHSLVEQNGGNVFEHTCEICKHLLKEISATPQYRKVVSETDDALESNEEYPPIKSSEEAGNDPSVIITHGDNEELSC